MNRHHRRRQHHRNVTEQAKSLLDATAHIADSQVAEVRNRISASIDAAQETLAEVEEGVGQVVSNAKVYVEARPYQAIGVAACLGALVGVVLARRCCASHEAKEPLL